MALPAAAAIAGGGKALYKGKSLGQSFTAAQRSRGGSMMHSSSLADRKTGSKLLKYDKDGKIAENIDAMKKKFDVGVGFIGKIMKTTGEILSALAKSSPALAQQMVVMNKAFKLFLRPIGDAIARWITPMARWMIRFAMRWYQLFGGRGGKSDIKDEIEQIKAQKKIAEDEGREGDVERLGNLLKAKESELANSVERNKKWLNVFGSLLIPINPLLGALFKNFDSIKDWNVWKSEWWSGMWSGVKDIGKTISEKIIIPAFNYLSNVGSRIWNDIVGPAFNFLSNVGSWIWTDIVRPGFNFLSNVGSWIWTRIIRPGFNYLSNVGSWIWTRILRPAFRFLDNVGSWIWNIISNGASGIWNWGSKVWDIIRNAAGNLAFWRSFAVGGDVPETGLYRLHAGERVITAGDVARGNNSNKSVNIVNHIHINANLSNDLDVKSLAKKLAEYNENELRRMITYG